jgi:uncharacterized protein (DUF849 family)
VSAAVVDAVVRAVRHAVPGVPIGVTSGAWSRGGDRQAAIAEWAALPDHVSVNFHEEGAEDLAATLLNRGIGVDAGLFTTTNGPATRIGLEDVLVHPDGTPAQDTADLVRSAIALGA